MVDLSRRWKLEYTDSNGNVQVIADTGSDGGDLLIDRHQHIRKKNDPDILKVWLEGEDFGNKIPTRKSEFGTASNGTNEPEILYKQYDPDTDSFVTRNRFYPKNKGTINEDGQLAWKLYSFYMYTGKQAVNTGNAGDIETALNNVLPSNYVADVPANALVPSTTEYSIDARREKGYQELTRDNRYALTFTSNLDGSNIKVKFEPEGFGGTVDTIVSNEQAGSFEIVDVNATSDTFFVRGDQTDVLVENQSILVTNSTGNNGTYDISSLTYDSNDNETDIVVSQNVSNSTADGVIIPGGQAIFKSWEKDKTDSIINKVRVEGTDKDGVTRKATVINKPLLDDFGEKASPPIKKGYVEDDFEPARIGMNYLRPGKENFSIQAVDTANDIVTINGDKTSRAPSGDDVIIQNSTGNDDVYEVSSSSYDSNNDETDITVVGDIADSTADGQIGISVEQPPESGTVKTTVYSDNVVNDSFQVVDNKRNIDDTYTVVQQRNFWPEGATELEFEFEQENLEQAARESENLRDERARLMPGTSTDVGNQDAGSLGNDTAKADNATSEDNKSPNTSGNTSVDFGDGQYVFNNTIRNASFTAGDSISVNDSAPNFTSLNTENFLVDTNIFIDSPDISSGDFTVTIENTTTNTTYFDETFSNVPLPANISPTVTQNGAIDGDTIQTQLTLGQGAGYSLSLNQTVDSLRQHDHTTSGSTDSHNHGVIVTDNGHGSSTDPTTHVISGKTAQQLIDLLQEVKTNR